MVSSRDDARMLLNKWVSDSYRVLAFHVTFPPEEDAESPADSQLSMSGRIRSGASPDIFALLTDSSDCLLVSLCDCQAQFHFSDSPQVPEIPLQIVPRGWESMLILIYETGFWVNFFAFPVGTAVEKKIPEF